MADEKGRLVDESDRLLAALGEIRAMESRKRAEDISSDEFNELAEQIHDKSREIFQITDQQEQLGRLIPHSAESIDDVDERT